MATNLQIFVYTMDEYKRFMKHLPVNDRDLLEDSYNEADYVGVQTRLMLLRKYYNNRGNVGLKSLIAMAEKEYPDRHEDWQKLSEEFNEITTQQLQHILSDGTKQTLYDTIEDTVYGLYLHANEHRIIRLMNTHESIRFICTRKYVLAMEKLMLRLAEVLTECGVTSISKTEASKAPALYMGDPKTNAQEIHASPYWGNVYGHDATDSEIEELIHEAPLEDNKILLHCLKFMSDLSDDSSAAVLKKYIHPLMRWNWGDFSIAKKFFSQIPNPGWSTKVRYNEQKTRAYVRIYPKVEGAFMLSTPHLFAEVCQFVLAKWFGEWYIFAFEYNKKP